MLGQLQRFVEFYFVMYAATVSGGLRHELLPGVGSAAANRFVPLSVF